MIGSAAPPLGAIVLGGDYQGLGVVKSLGRHGVPTLVLDDEHSVARYSRYATHHLRVPDLRGEDAIMAALQHALASFDVGGWVLFPTRDEMVATLSRRREQLSASFTVPTPPWEIVEWIWDKRKTYERAAALGIPVPRTWCPSDPAELDDLAAHLPLALKPAIKERFIYETRAKAWRADTPSELRRRFEDGLRVVQPGELMVQELIPGGGRQQLAFCAYFKDGAAIGRMTARRRRQHPHEFGRASTYVETLDDPGIEEQSSRFLGSLGYYGLAELEYKEDPRDGVVKLLDVNARTWGYHLLGLRAGVDFCHMLYLDQVGKPVEPSCAVPGMGWIRLATDIPTAAIDLVRGRLTAGEYLRSLARSNVESVFSRDDWRPGVAELALLPYLAVRRGF